jgi:hypothetical protein
VVRNWLVRLGADRDSRGRQNMKSPAKRFVTQRHRRILRNDCRTIRS